MIRRPALLLVLVSSLSCSSPKTVARSAQAVPTSKVLLQGTWVPERREFPVNPEIDPCDDLYEYACSKALSAFQLRDDRSAHAFAFNDSAERLLTAKRNYLNWLLQAEQTSSRSRTLKNVYGACMNEESSKAEEKRLVAAEVALLSGIRSRAEFIKLLDQRLDSPDEKLVSFDAETENQADPLRYDLTFIPKIKFLPERSYYDRPELIRDLTEVYSQFFRTLGFANAEARARAVIDFEKRYAAVHPLPADLRQRWSQKRYVSRKTLIKSYGKFPLRRFLARIPASTQVRDLFPEAFRFFNTALERESLATLKDLWLVRSVPGLMDDAYPEVFSKFFDFAGKHLGGAKTRPVREERCARLVMRDFGRELDADLLPILYKDFPEQKVIALAEKVRSTLVSDLSRNQWLSASARAMAMKKMSNATLLLFKPATEEEWDFSLPAPYTPDQRYENARIRRAKEIEKELGELGKKRNRRRWLMSPLIVNAYYTAADNTFVLPAGILQYPFYDPAAPEETNLAAIGSVIGHELGHGIDDEGSKYDDQGVLSQWMSPEDLRQFEARGARLIPRFEKRGHNGRLTMGENIGDHVGISTSYAAAFGPQGQGSIDAKKAFFLQYARAWCYVARPTFKEMQLKTNPHALGEARVNEQVVHLPGFQETFGCRAGKKMFLDASERIRIW